MFWRWRESGSRLMRAVVATMFFVAALPGPSVQAQSQPISCFMPQSTTTVALGPNEQQPAGIALADLNTDGNIDFVTAHHGSNTASSRMGDGAGHFNPPTAPSAPDTIVDFINTVPSAIALGEFNGDGKADAVVASTAGGSTEVSILR